MLAYPAISRIFPGQHLLLKFKCGSQAPDEANTVAASACKIRKLQRFQSNKKELDNGEMVGR